MYYSYEPNFVFRRIRPTSSAKKNDEHLLIFFHGMILFSHAYV
jgi:hypothetical protein